MASYWLLKRRDLKTFQKLGVLSKQGLAGFSTIHNVNTFQLKYRTLNPSVYGLTNLEFENLFCMRLFGCCLENKDLKFCLELRVFLVSAQFYRSKNVSKNMCSWEVISPLLLYRL